jgi:hypothetical protein
VHDEKTVIVSDLAPARVSHTPMNFVFTLGQTSGESLAMPRQSVQWQSAWLCHMSCLVASKLKVNGALCCTLIKPRARMGPCEGVLCTTSQPAMHTR